MLRLADGGRALPRNQPALHTIGYFILLYIVTNVAITFSVNRNLLALAAANKKSEVLASTLKSKNITLDAALNNMTHGLAMFDPQLTLAICNAKFGELYRLPGDLASPGTPLSGFIDQMSARHFLAPDLAKELGSTCRRVLQNQQPAICEVSTESAQNFVVSVEPTSEGGILILTEDATARKATEAQIERMAHFDELTGLANRFQFSNALKAICARTRRKPGNSLSFTSISIISSRSTTTSGMTRVMRCLPAPRSGCVRWSGAVT